MGVKRLYTHGLMLLPEALRAPFAAWADAATATVPAARARADAAVGEDDDVARAGVVVAGGRARPTTRSPATRVTRPPRVAAARAAAARRAARARARGRLRRDRSAPARSLPLPAHRAARARGRAARSAPRGRRARARACARRAGQRAAHALANASADARRDPLALAPGAPRTRARAAPFDAVRGLAAARFADAFRVADAAHPGAFDALGGEACLSRRVTTRTCEERRERAARIEAAAGAATRPGRAKRPPPSIVRSRPATRARRPARISGTTCSRSPRGAGCSRRASSSRRGRRSAP